MGMGTRGWSIGPQREQKHPQSPTWGACVGQGGSDGPGWLVQGGQGAPCQQPFRYEQEIRSEINVLETRRGHPVEYQALSHPPQPLCLISPVLRGFDPGWPGPAGQGLAQHRASEGPGGWFPGVPGPGPVQDFGRAARPPPGARYDPLSLQVVRWQVLW